MLRIVLPAAIASPGVDSVAAVGNIRISIEIVIDVDIYVVMSPSTAPAPATAPSCSHRNADAKRNRHSRYVGTRWRRRRIVNRWIWIYRWAVHHSGVVTRNIHYLRIRLLNHDDLFVLDDLRFDLLLIARLEIPLILGFLAHALDRIHDVALLRQEGIAQIRRPFNVVGKPVHNVGQSRHCLHARIPVLFLHCIYEGLVLEVLVLP